MKHRSLCLLGRDHVEFGPIASAALPDGGAISLSRGALDKPYAYTDPNEDGALVVRSDAGALLAVTDGHTGQRASELALAEVRAAAPELIRARGEAFRSGIVDVVERLIARLGRDSSHTCLIVAVLAERRVEYASFGDSSLYRASSARAVTIPDEQCFLGRPFVIAERDPATWYGSFEREPAERVALVTDGITNFHPEAERLGALVGAAEDDLDCARSLAIGALRGGAGDNVAVSTLSCLA